MNFFAKYQRKTFTKPFSARSDIKHCQLHNLILILYSSNLLDFSRLNKIVPKQEIFCIRIDRISSSRGSLSDISPVTILPVRDHGRPVSLNGLSVDARGGSGFLSRPTRGIASTVSEEKEGPQEPREPERLTSVPIALSRPNSGRFPPRLLSRRAGLCNSLPLLGSKTTPSLRFFSSIIAPLCAGRRCAEKKILVGTARYL